MQANKKDSIAAWSAVGMLVFGVALTSAGFLVPPIGEVHDSVLWILGQALLYAGSMFGLGMYTKHKFDELEASLHDKINSQLPNSKSNQNE